MADTAPAAPAAKAPKQEYFVRAQVLAEAFHQGLIEVGAITTPWDSLPPERQELAVKAAEFVADVFNVQCKEHDDIQPFPEGDARKTARGLKGMCGYCGSGTRG